MEGLNKAYAVLLGVGSGVSWLLGSRTRSRSRSFSLSISIYFSSAYIKDKGIYSFQTHLMVLLRPISIYAYTYA